jgi:hypothetical protein
MPFGLTNAGDTFQRAMQIDFDDLISKIIQIYLDDLTIYFRNQQYHFDHLRKVFLCCRKIGMSLNPTKSFFGVIECKIVGHIIFDSGINIDLERVIAKQNLQAPSSKKEIQSFMGKINFVRRFIPDFARMVNPIHNMIQQDR